MRDMLQKIEMFVANANSFIREKPYRCLALSFIAGSIVTAAVGLHFEHERAANAASDMTAPVPPDLPPAPGPAPDAALDACPPGTTPVPALLSDQNGTAEAASSETPE